MVDQPKTIVLTGGGTGGHITPILAVAHELKKKQPDLRIVYIGERDSKFAELTAMHEAIDEVYTIFAGKFRRYHGQSLFTRVFDVKTNLFNIRDLLYFGIGTIQSWFLLGKIKPTAALLKGGFVGVPVGLAAAARKVPFVTHDSDALPGLANRIVSRWAAMHATALPGDEYNYPKDKVMQVGVLLEPHFTEVSEAEQGAFKSQLNLPTDKPLLLITCGSSGAQRINEAVVKNVDKLLADYPDLRIIHQVGKGKQDVYGSYQHDRLVVLEFMRPMYAYTGAADVVVARASANTIAELGAQTKPVIVVASPFLSGGHQLMNAERWEKLDAVVSVPESANATDELRLDGAIRELLSDETKRRALALRLHEITITDAAAKLADILLQLKKQNP